MAETTLAETTLRGPQGTLTIERELIPVYYESDIDADWAYTDRAGHGEGCDREMADDALDWRPAGTTTDPVVIRTQLWPT